MIKSAKYSDQQYRELVSRKPSLQMMSILPSLICNARCKFCPIWGKHGWALDTDKGDTIEQLDLNVLSEFIDGAVRHNSDRFFWVIITGGEPLMYKNITELIRFLRKNRLPVIVFTNGFLAERYAEEIVENVVSLTFSIDGPPEIHNDVRQIPNLFQKACDGIEAILKLKKHRRSLFPMVRINYVISQYNIDHIPAFVEAVETRFKPNGTVINYDVDFIMEPDSILVNFDPLQFTTTDLGNKYEEQMRQCFNYTVPPSWRSLLEDNLKLDAQSAKNYLEKLWEKHETDFSDFVDLETYFTDVNETFGRTRCLTPWNELLVRQNGEVYFCPHYKDYSIGNIYQSSFQDIWEGQRAKDFRCELEKDLLYVCNRCCRLWADYDYQKIDLTAV